MFKNPPWAAELMFRRESDRPRHSTLYLCSPEPSSSSAATKLTFLHVFHHATVGPH